MSILHKGEGEQNQKIAGPSKEAFSLKRRRWLGGKSGHGQMIAAIAEAGVGKSRLLHEFKAITQSGSYLENQWCEWDERKAEGRA